MYNMARLQALVNKQVELELQLETVRFEVEKGWDTPATQNAEIILEELQHQVNFVQHQAMEAAELIPAEMEKMTATATEQAMKNMNFGGLYGDNPDEE